MLIKCNEPKWWKLLFFIHTSFKNKMYKFSILYFAVLFNWIPLWIIIRIRTNWHISLDFPDRLMMIILSTKWKTVRIESKQQSANSIIWFNHVLHKSCSSVLYKISGWFIDYKQFRDGKTISTLSEFKWVGLE